MIYELSRDVEELLVAKKFPYRITYTDRFPQRGGGPHIYFKRDRNSNADAIEAAVGMRRNPDNVAVRWLGVEARIYAQSTAKGSHVGEHERECEAVVDGLIYALHHWVTEGKAAIRYNEARFLDAKDLDDQEKWSGVVYMLRFSIGRGVDSRDYTGAITPTGTISSVGSVTHVRYEGQPDSDPAIGCGEDP